MPPWVYADSSDDGGKGLWDLAEYLPTNRPRLMAAARTQIDEARLAHYSAEGLAATEQRVRSLYEGVTLEELQTAVNAVESTSWRAISTDVPADRLTEVLEQVATVLGAIKDHVGCEYVAAATATPRIAVDRLFAGTEANLTE